jgi:hypothetical protein
MFIALIIMIRGLGESALGGGLLRVGDDGRIRALKLPRPPVRAT